MPLAQDIGESILRHLAFLEKLTASEARKIRVDILKAQRSIRSIVAKNADVFDGRNTLTPRKLNRLELILVEIETELAQLELVIDRKITTVLVETANAERGLIVNALNSPVPEFLALDLAFVAMPIERIARLPFNTIKNKDYLERLSEHTIRTLNRSKDSLVTSLITGESERNAAARLATVIDETYAGQAQRIVRTELHRTAIDVITETYKENKRFIERIEWSTALDDRVCHICRGLRADSLAYGRGSTTTKHIWTVDLAPQPVYDSHPMCRCIPMSILKDTDGLLGELGLSRSDVPPEVLSNLDNRETRFAEDISEFLSTQDLEFVDAFLASKNQNISVAEFEMLTMQHI